MFREPSISAKRQTDATHTTVSVTLARSKLSQSGIWRFTSRESETFTTNEDNGLSAAQSQGGFLGETSRLNSCLWVAVSSRKTVQTKNVYKIVVFSRLVSENSLIFQRDRTDLNRTTGQDY